MNERIQELAVQADAYAWEQIDEGANFDEQPQYFAEKFAELIVRECMDIAKRTGENFGSANSDVLEGGRGGAFCVYQNIKNTFGVEE